MFFEGARLKNPHMEKETSKRLRETLLDEFPKLPTLFYGCVMCRLLSGLTPDRSGEMPGPPFWLFFNDLPKRWKKKINTKGELSISTHAGDKAKLENTTSLSRSWHVDGLMLLPPVGGPSTHTQHSRSFNTLFDNLGKSSTLWLHNRFGTVNTAR